MRSLRLVLALFLVALGFAGLDRGQVEAAACDGAISASVNGMVVTFNLSIKSGQPTEVYWSFRRQNDSLIDGPFRTVAPFRWSYDVEPYPAGTYQVWAVMHDAGGACGAEAYEVLTSGGGARPGAKPDNSVAPTPTSPVGPSADHETLLQAVATLEAVDYSRSVQGADTVATVEAAVATVAADVSAIVLALQATPLPSPTPDLAIQAMATEVAIFHADMLSDTAQIEPWRNFVKGSLTWSVLFLAGILVGGIASFAYGR